MKPKSYSSQTAHNRKKSVRLLQLGGSLLLALSIGLLLVVARQAKDKDETQEVANVAQIEITKDGFIPETLSVPKGTKVTWTNSDKQPRHIASNPHPVHDGLAGLDSKEVIGSNGGTYSFTFDKPGEYGYHDHLNPTVNGIVKVAE